MSGTIHFKTDGPVATVTLDSPGKLNAVSVAMWLELRRVFDALAGDTQIHCVLIRGAGGNFAAGADVDEFREVRHNEASGRRFHLDTVAPALDAIRSTPQPVLAEIEGVCVGGGLEIALASDLRIAADTARLGMPVGRLGFPLVLPELRPLLQLVGPGVASDLLLAGRLLNAVEAEAKGLVSRTVPAAELEHCIAETVRAVCAGSPRAARQNKAQIRLLQQQSMTYTAHDLDAGFSFLVSEDYREGMAAFLAKRTPQFTGK